MDVPCPTETMVLAETIIIFIPVMTIYSILNRTDAYRCPNTALDLAWDEWGVKGTRAVRRPSDTVCLSVCGTKAIVTYKDKETFSLCTFDINQGLAPHGRQGAVTPAGGHDAALVTMDDLGGACDDDRHGLPASGLPPGFEMETGRMCMSWITEPTTLPSTGMPPQILLDTVTSTLPYRLSEWRMCAKGAVEPEIVTGEDVILIQTFHHDQRQWTVLNAVIGPDPSDDRNHPNPSGQEAV